VERACQRGSQTAQERREAQNKIARPVSRGLSTIRPVPRRSPAEMGSRINRRGCLCPDTASRGTKNTCLLTHHKRFQKALILLTRYSQKSGGFLYTSSGPPGDGAEWMTNGRSRRWKPRRTAPEAGRTQARFRTIQDCPKDIKGRQGHS
jgi:hypothetical protein